MKNKKSFIILLLFSVIFLVLGIFIYSSNIFVKMKDNYINIELKAIKYTVKKTDTLEYILYKFNISRDEFNKINNNISTVKYQDVINIPNVGFYKIKNEKNIEQLSDKFNISVDKIKSINDLEDLNIGVLKIIKIPNPNIYTVKYGDTINKISEKFSVSKKSILKFNKIEEKDIVKGFNIVIPKSSFHGYEKDDLIDELSPSENLEYNQLFLAGNELYENNKYLNLRKDSKNFYYLTIKELLDLGYKIDNLASRCNEDTRIIYFDPEHKDKYKGNPIIFNFKCDA